jgi:hypothetical protein
MKVEYRTTVIGDVYAILERLSDTNDAELANAGHTRWSALKEAHVWLKSGEAETMFVDDDPVAVLGHFKHEAPGARVTWFIATQRFWELGFTGVRLARKYLTSLQARYPGVVFYSYPQSGHKDTARWFTLLGYDPIYSLGRIIGYRLDPPVRDDKPRWAC